MDNNLTMANHHFDFLRQSNEFLCTILDSINSCVLILDKDVKLRAYNDSLKTIFSNKKNEDLLYVKCGEAIGCAYQVEEQVECGKSSKCNTCELRRAALTSYVDNKMIYKEHVVRPFITFDNKKVDKHLQFSTRIFHFEEEKYIIMIIEDISKWFDSKFG